MFTKKHWSTTPLLIKTYTYLDADNHNIALFLKYKIFLLINFLNRTVFEKRKENKGCWAELRAVNTSKLQYSRPDKKSEAKLQGRTTQLSYI